MFLAFLVPDVVAILGLLPNYRLERGEEMKAEAKERKKEGRSGGEGKGKRVGVDAGMERGWKEDETYYWSRHLDYCQSVDYQVSD